MRVDTAHSVSKLQRVEIQETAYCMSDGSGLLESGASITMTG